MHAFRLSILAVSMLILAAVPSRPTAAAAADEPPPALTTLATFAGGCFWCMEGPFDALPGVLATTVGYTGGRTPDPTYPAVSAGGTGHAEAVQVSFDPARVSYQQLLDVFWKNVDPTDAGGQFCDRGDQYRSAVFTHDAEQQKLATASRDAVAKRLGKPVETTIVPATKFHPAEDYHQDYARKNPIRYRFYRTSCGRDRRLEALWGKASH
jgi:peptide-methionine (S)-S-oxide reductase